MGDSMDRSVTEVVFTHLKPGQEAAYHAISDRFSAAQAEFPGYLGAFVQPPKPGGTTWTTVIRFDTVENLERWLTSERRAALVNESLTLSEGFTTHRIDGSFPGWVPANPQTGSAPSMWKTAALVLLTLFPVVMLELKFLNPHLTSLNPALATFIGNIASVALTTWPLMPLAIRAFRGWLYPDEVPAWARFVYPAALLVAYGLELAIFRLLF